MTTKIIGNKGGKGGGGTTRSAQEAPNTLQSRSTARVIDIISHGECIGLADRTNPLRSVYYDGLPIENADGSKNWSGVEIQERLGLPDQEPFSGFDDAEEEIVANLEITTLTPRIIRITDSTTDALRVKIRIPALTNQNKENGDLNGASVSYKIESRIVDGAWTQVVWETLNEKCTTPQELQYRVDKPEGAGSLGWEIRTTRITPDTSDVTLQNKTYLAAVTKLIHAKLQYADFGAVAQRADSEQFGDRIPPRAFDWVGMVLDVPSNYTAPHWDTPLSGRSYSGLWDGTFKRSWTDNPAWILWGMLTDPEWGLGRVIKPSQVDKWSLYQIAQYCDAYNARGSISWTNLVYQSSALNLTPWTSANSLTPTQDGLDPLGNPAWKVVPTTTSTSSHYRQQTYPTTDLTENSTITVTFYAKNAGYNFVRLQNRGKSATAYSAIIDLTTGVTSSVSGGTTCVTTDMGNGWWKVTHTFPCGTGTSTGLLRLFAHETSSIATAFAGDGIKGVTFGSAQYVENNANARYGKNEETRLLYGTDDYHAVTGRHGVSDGNGGFEPRYRINTQITTSEQAYAMLQSIASVFRGMAYWGSGSVTFISDQPSDPVKLVSPANVLEGEFTYTGTALKNRHSSVRVSWNDPADNFKLAIEIIEDPEMIRRFGHRPTDITAFGCTSRSQAIRMGRWLLDTERYETETVTYRASFDHADVRPGNIIEVYDPSYAGVRMGGRITAVTNTSATIDAPITIESGETYEVNLVRPDGTVITRTLTNGVGETSTLTWASSLVTLPSSSAVLIFSTAVETQRRVMTNLTSTSVTFRQDVEIDSTYTYYIGFTLEDGSIVNRPLSSPTSGRTFTWTTPLSVLPSIESQAFVYAPNEGYVSATTSSQGSTSATLSSSFTFLEDYDYEAMFAFSDGTKAYRKLTNAPGTTSTITWSESVNALPVVGSMWGVVATNLAPRQFKVLSVREVEQHIFEVTALTYDPNKYARIEEGLVLPPAETTVYTSTAVPEPPTNLSGYRRPVLKDGVFSDRINIFWDKSPSPYVGRYRVAYKKDDGEYIALTDSFSNSAEFESRGPGTYTFSIRAINLAGRESLALYESMSLLDERPFGDPIIKNIAIEGESTSVSEWTGNDLKVSWEVEAPTDWWEDVTEGWEDPYLKDYVVQVRNTSDVVLGTFYTKERRFVLSKERNIELSGTPLRSVKIAVAFRDVKNEVHSYTVKTFTNPAPAAPSSVSIESSIRSLTVTVPRASDLDYSSTRFWVSTTSGFNPVSTTPSFEGPSTQFTTDVVPGTTYYVRVAYLDDFSSASADLNISSQSSHTVVGVDVGDLDTTPPANVSGTPTLSFTSVVNPDGTHVVRMAASWTAVTSASGYDIEISDGVTPWVEWSPTNSIKNLIVRPGLTYTIKVKAVGRTGLRSTAWSTTSSGVAATADTSVPAAVISGSVSAIGGRRLRVILKRPTDPDYSHALLYRNTTGVSPDDVPIDAIADVYGDTYVDVAATVGASSRYWARSVDRTGNQCGTATYLGSAVATYVSVDGGDVSPTDDLLITSRGTAGDVSRTASTVSDVLDLNLDVLLSRTLGVTIEQDRALVDAADARDRFNVLGTVDPIGRQSVFNGDTIQLTPGGLFMDDAETRVGEGLSVDGDVARPLTLPIADSSNILRRTAGGLYAGDLTATEGATWGLNVTSRPTELTDGRIPAGLSSSGDVARPLTLPIADSSNILRKTGGGLFTGDNDATLGATWGTNLTGRPTELTDGRVVSGLASNGDVARPLTSTLADSSNILRRTSGGIYTGSLAATAGATWGTDVSGRPTELTDGRITTALNSSGVLQTAITTTLANTSNILRRSGGGIYTGALAATAGATWGVDIASRPTELTDGRVAAGLDSSGDIARPLTVSIANSSNLLRRTGGGTFTGALDATNDTAVTTLAGTLGALATSSLTETKVQGRYLGEYAGDSAANAAGFQDGDVYIDTSLVPTGLKTKRGGTIKEVDLSGIRAVFATQQDVTSPTFAVVAEQTFTVSAGSRVEAWWTASIETSPNPTTVGSGSLSCSGSWRIEEVGATNRTMGSGAFSAAASGGTNVTMLTIDSVSDSLPVPSVPTTPLIVPVTESKTYRLQLKLNVGDVKPLYDLGVRLYVQVQRVPVT